jgi:23S rRNA pseudouridine955/2504/2580 synthase
MRPPGEQLQALLRAAVLFEDEHLLVLNKPAGLAVHAGTGVKQGLIEALRAMYPDLPALELVHRLDKGTSGCILLAKTGKARKSLSEGFRQHQVTKIYHALVAGRWPKQIRSVDASLQRQTPRGGERRVIVADEGKEARTEFSILRQYPEATLVEARPLTGRTHQIRVHAALAGCPLLGDAKYNTAASNTLYAKLGIRRLCLHAAELRVAHPATGAPLVLTAPYDAAFTQALLTLDQANNAG